MVSCGGSLVKIILFVFNFLWLILGGVVIWLGATTMSWSGDIGEVMNNGMAKGSIAVIVAGALIFLVAFLGCCGACKENSCMLSTYGGIILILVILQCVGVGFAFYYKNKVNDDIKDSIRDQINKFLNTSHDYENAAKLIQNIQKSFKCCGVEDYTKDYRGHPLASCCDQDFKDDYTKTCLEDQVVFKEGCGSKVVDILGKYLGGTAGVGIALILIQLLIVVMACCLSREVRN